MRDYENTKNQSVIKLTANIGKTINLDVLYQVINLIATDNGFWCPQFRNQFRNHKLKIL